MNWFEGALSVKAVMMAGRRPRDEAGRRSEEER